MGTSCLRREKSSLMSWFSRLMEPFEVAREMRPSWKSYQHILSDEGLKKVMCLGRSLED